MRLPRPVQDAVDALLGELKRISDSLQKQSEPTSKYQQSTKEPETPPLAQPLVNISEAICSTSETSEKNEKRYQDRNFWISIAGVASVVAYTTVAAIQSCTMTKTLSKVDEQTKIASQQLRSGRAYWVLNEYKTAQLYSMSTKEITGFRFQIVYENLGNTPALDAELIQDFAKVTRDEFKHGTTHLDIPDWEHRRGPRIPVSVAPHQITVATLELPVEDIKKMERGELFVYLWTQARYHDIFDKDTTHRTDTCVQLIQYSDLRMESPFRFQLNCSQHNHQD